MYDVLLTSGSTSNINNFTDFMGSGKKTLEIPYNPPIVPRDHNVFSNKKTENLERLENQLQFWYKQPNISSNLKITIYKDILSELSKAHKKSSHRNINLKKLPKRALPQNKPKKNIKIPKKIGWSEILQTLDNPPKKQKTIKIRKNI